MRRLIVTAGKADPSELELVLEAGGEVLLGRAGDADLRLYDETASRRHATVREENGRTLLVDLGSANGILLNGEAVAGQAALFDGDEIRIGDVRLRYVVGGGSDRETVVVAAGAEDAHVEAAVDPDTADPAGDVGARDAAQRLRLVCDAAIACADASAYGEVPEVLLGLAVETFAPDRATVTLRTLDGGEHVAAGYPPEASAPTSATLRARVVEGGEAVLVRDARGSQVAHAARSMVASRYRSTLAAPLATAEGVLGFIALEAEAPDRFGEEDLRALAAVARQAALALRNLRTLSSARAEVDRLARASGETAASATLLGADASMEAVRTLIGKAAAVDTPVLVTGDTGTGKELVARALHAGSPRHEQPFVALNCAALVEGLLESELFGHEKGAFTGAEALREGRIVDAASGTLFLDEVGELPPGLQAKLLRVLSEGTFTRVGGRKTLQVQCRLVAATNRDLEAEVEAGSFRRDLYHRLAVLTIHLPPLKDRGADVELLAESALERIAARLAKRPPRLAQDAREVLQGLRVARQRQGALQRPGAGPCAPRRRHDHRRGPSPADEPRLRRRGRRTTKSSPSARPRSGRCGRH